MDPRHELSRRAGRLVPVTLPPIDRLPADEAIPQSEFTDDGSPSALEGFLENVTRWDTVPIAVSSRVTVALWLLLTSDIAVAAWLFGVLHGSSECEAGLCAVATLGGHPATTFGLASISGFGLLAMSARTRGLSQGGRTDLIVVSAAALMASAAVIGAVLVVLFLALAATLLLITLVAVLIALVTDS
jgi:hypothetical protein